MSSRETRYMGTSINPLIPTFSRREKGLSINRSAHMSRNKVYVIPRDEGTRDLILLGNRLTPTRLLGPASILE